jgi:hypothetical protein
VHGLGANPEWTWKWKVSGRDLQHLAASTAFSDPINKALKELAHGPGADDKKRHISLLDHVLKPEFPEARILKFCYNSDWFINAPAVTPKQKADALLTELAKVRASQLVRIRTFTLAPMLVSLIHL